MKIGNLTKLTNVTITSSDTPLAGKEGVNILDNDLLKIWEVVGDEPSLLLQFDPIEYDGLTLHNITTRSSITITSYITYPTQIWSTTTIIKASDFTGFYVENAFEDGNGSQSNKHTGGILGEFILGEHVLSQEGTNLISAINIQFNGPGVFAHSLGYIWAGDFIDFGCAENMAPADETSDIVDVSRTNHPTVNDSYEFQAYKVTLKKNTNFKVLRAKFRKILTSGLGTSRPFMFNEDMFGDPEIFLGIIPSNKIGYSVIESDDTTDPMTQATFAIREVL